MNIDTSGDIFQTEIMVVEDNPHDLKLMLNILKEAGYKVRPAIDGALALRSIGAKRPDLILLDVNLPDMNGVEVCRQLKSKPETKDIPVIFISALGKPDLKVKALEGGGVDFITKPFDQSEILVRIKTHINLHLLRLKLQAQSEELIKEIDERKRIEKQLEDYSTHLEEQVKQRTAYLWESEKDLKESQRIAHVGSWRLDLATNKVVWSEELYKMYGFNPELPPPPYTEHKKLFTSKSWEELSSALDNTRDTGIPYELELETLRQEGSHGWMWVCGEAISDKSGRIVGLRGAAQEITERKHAEEKLYKSKETLRAIFNASPLAIVLIDKSGNIIDSNEEHANRLKMKRSETLGKCLWDMLPQSVRVHRKMQVESVFETGEPFTGEDKRGMVWSEYYIHPAIKNKNGEIEAVIVEALDITERKKAEESLKESKIFLEKMSDIAYMADNEGNLTWVNSAVERITGLSVEEITGKSFLPLFVEEDHVSLKDVYKRTLMGESLENILTFTSGVTCHFTSLPKRNDKGEIIGTFGVARDITERLKAEKALQISEDRLKKAQAVAKIGNWEYDISKGQVWGSEEAFRIYGIEQKSQFLPLNEVENCIIEAKRVNQSLVDLITKNVPYDIEFEIKPVNREGITVIHSIAELVCDENGNPLKVTGVIQDITESKTKEKDRQKLRSQLQQAQKMESVGRLAGGVAHDFNNMLSVILGHTEVIMDQIDSSHLFFANLQEIKSAAQRSADLTRQLLAFARKQTISPKVLDLNETVDGMLTMLQRLIGEDIDLLWLPGKKLWPINIDPSQIDQILANLCVNARDAITGVGKLTIETGFCTFDESYCVIHQGFSPGDYVSLTVSDNGSGMDIETQAKIFEPFFTTKTMDKGTGLGLSTVYGIVKQNNGFINVYSQTGKGTTFKIYLPRHIGKADQLQQKNLTEPVIHGNESILLVEDEPAILNLTTMMLQRLGYTVLAAPTPGEAISLAREHIGKIDLLMTDVIMPEMNGRDLAKNLLSLYPNLKRLFMSGYTANVIAHHGVLDEGVNFIQKPFSREDLSIKVRAALGND